LVLAGIIIAATAVVQSSGRRIGAVFRPEVPGYCGRGHGSLGRTQQKGTAGVAETLNYKN